MYLGASIRIIPCSGGQYASFDTPHAYLKTKFQHLEFFEKIKKGRGRSGMSANLEWFKVCFLSSGDNMLLLVPTSLV